MQFYMLLVDNQELHLSFFSLETLMQNFCQQKDSMCNIGATFTFIYFTISINRSSDLNLKHKKEIYIRVVCNVIV